MSISNELIILNTTKLNIKTSINLKGVSVTDEAFAEYPDKVRLIPNGGGVYESNIILYIEGKLKNAVIPYGTTSIGENAFSGTDIETISIPNTVTSIGDYAIDSCNKLTVITIPNSVTSIGTGALSNCSGLTSLTIPDSVSTIGEYGISGCFLLTSIEIGTGITSIGHNAFYGGRVLNYIAINAVSPPSIESDTFDNTNNCPIYVPDASVLAYQTATNWDTYSARITGISNKPV